MMKKNLDGSYRYENSNYDYSSNTDHNNDETSYDSGHHHHHH